MQMDLTPAAGAAGVRGGRERRRRAAVGRLSPGGRLHRCSITGRSACATRAAAGASGPATRSSHHEDGPLDLTVGAGVARASFEIPLASYIPILEVDDFTRWTVDFAPAADRHVAQLVPGLGRAEVPLLALQHGDAAFHTRRRHARPRQLRGAHHLLRRPGRVRARVPVRLLRVRADAGRGVRHRRRHGGRPIPRHGRAGRARHATSTASSSIPPSASSANSEPAGRARRKPGPSRARSILCTRRMLRSRSALIVLLPALLAGGCAVTGGRRKRFRCARTIPARRRCGG